MNHLSRREVVVVKHVFFADILAQNLKVDYVFCFLWVFRVSWMATLVLVLIAAKRLFKLVVVALQLLVFCRFFEWGQPFGCCSLAEVDYRAGFWGNHTFPFLFG